jgi:hypothetical protein
VTVHEGVLDKWTCICLHACSNLAHGYMDWYTMLSFVYQQYCQNMCTRDLLGFSHVMCQRPISMFDEQILQKQIPTSSQVASQRTGVVHVHDVDTAMYSYDK